MFRKLFLIATCAALLAACGGNNTATPAPVAQQSAPTEIPTATGIPFTEAPREYSTEEVQLPLPGTIVAAVTPDPDAGKLYDTVELIRTGGLTGEVLDVIVNSDGTLTRNGTKSTIPAEQVKEISDKIDQLGFFGMQGIFQAPGGSADIYTYTISASRSGGDRSITAQEGYTPPQLTDLFDLLTKLGTAS